MLSKRYESAEVKIKHREHLHNILSSFKQILFFFLLCIIIFLFMTSSPFRILSYFNLKMFTKIFLYKNIS